MLHLWLYPLCPLSLVTACNSVVFQVRGSLIVMTPSCHQAHLSIRIMWHGSEPAVRIHTSLVSGTSYLSQLISPHCTNLPSQPCNVVSVCVCRVFETDLVPSVICCVDSPVTVEYVVVFIKPNVCRSPPTFLGIGTLTENRMTVVEGLFAGVQLPQCPDLSELMPDLGDALCKIMALSSKVGRGISRCESMTDLISGPVSESAQQPGQAHGTGIHAEL